MICMAFPRSTMAVRVHLRSMNPNDILLHFSSFFTLRGSYLVCLGVGKTRPGRVRARELGMVQVRTSERGMVRVRTRERGGPGQREPGDRLGHNEGPRASSLRLLFGAESTCSHDRPTFRLGSGEASKSQIRSLSMNRSHSTVM